MNFATTVSIAVVFSAVACSHHQAPQTARSARSTGPTQTALVAPPEPANTPITPGAASIPNEPQVAPPQPPPVQPAEKLPIATSANLASPRPESLPPVAADPVRDQPETGADAESIREIRALLAADKSLSTTARQITIVAVKGRVRLSGQVNTAEERASIERAARKAANVIDVKNQLVVLQ
ncbi:MAG TPA: BON domain-containing protein [Polyangiaceae bacterium]|nr:BON domain-containing protein [Polyangiaceae bacterium]